MMPRSQKKVLFVIICITMVTLICCSDDNGVTVNESKDDNGSDFPIRNKPPETWLNASIIEKSEFDMRIHFYWSGWDIDGTIASYQWAISVLDTILEWSIIHQKDSIFVFALDPEFPATQHFHVRSIDDDGMMDPTPASYLVEFE